MNRFPWIGVLSLALVGITALGFYLAAPRVVEVEPAPASNEVAGSTPLRLRFSRLMEADTVTERLEITPPRAGKTAWEGSTFVFYPDQPWKSGETVTVRLDKGSRAKNFPRLQIAQSQEWSFQVGNPILVYLYPADQKAGLYAINPQNGENTPLYAEAEEVLDYSISADGRAIFFSTRDGSNSQLYRLERNGSVPQLLHRFENGQVGSVQLSPSGEFFAFELMDFRESKVKTHIWLLPNDGNPQAVPLRLPDDGGPSEMPLWSSRNVLAYYDQSAQRYRFYDPQPGQEIASVACQTGEQGAWMPDGESFVFPEITPSSGPNPPASHLLRFQLTTGNLENISQKMNAEDTSPAFSPDQRWLVFARKYLDPLQWTPGRQIWLMNLATGEMRPLLQEAAYNHYAFAWSPDSGWIAFVRFNQMDPTQPPELWMINADGSQPRQLMKGGYAPQWMP